MTDSEIQTEQNNTARPKRRWLRLWLLSLAVIYTPFLIAAIQTWLFVSCNHCKLTWLKYFWLLPGMTLMYCLRFFDLDLDENDITSMVILGILPIVIVCLITWLASKGRIIRWITWIVCCLLSALVALMAYGLVRA